MLNLISFCLYLNKHRAKKRVSQQNHTLLTWIRNNSHPLTPYILYARVRARSVKPAKSLVKKNKNHENPFELMLCLHVEPLMKCHCDFPCVAHTCVLGSLTNHTDKITMPLHHPKGSSINPKAINRNKLISGCRCNDKCFFGLLPWRGWQPSMGGWWYECEIYRRTWFLSGVEGCSPGNFVLMASGAACTHTPVRDIFIIWNI